MSPILPASPSLPVAHLAASFGDVTNAYKFYWLLAILAHVRANAVPQNLKKLPPGKDNKLKGQK